MAGNTSMSYALIQWLNESLENPNHRVSKDGEYYYCVRVTNDGPEELLEVFERGAGVIEAGDFYNA